MNLFSFKGPIHRAVQSGMTEMVDLLLNAGADVNQRSPLDGWTPFHFAVMAGSSSTNLVFMCC